MPDQPELEELVMHLVRSSRLTESEARKVVDEVLAFMDETPEEFIRRRHLALQSRGLSNAEIFARIATDLQTRRFRSPELSERQIRRIIYG
jgi:polyhydroxyalkanoate synthesis regulator phasin